MPVITERLVSRLQPRKKKYEISCSSLRGFMLRVLPSGKKVYFARVRHGGKDTRQRIGLASEIPFDEARRLAGDLLARAMATSRPRVGASHRASVEAPDTSPYVRDFTRRFVDGHVRIAIKPATARRYELALKNHILPRFGSVRLAAITREDVETWVGSYTDKPQAARCAWQVLSCLFGKAIQWDALPANHLIPTRGVRTKQPKVRDRFLTADERARIEVVIQQGLDTPRNQPGGLHWAIAYAIRTLALTGMRSSEVYSLSWERVDMARRSFRLPDSKTGQKVVSFSEEVRELLIEVARLGDGRSKWVFPSWDGSGHVARASVGKAWRRIRTKAGLGSDVVVHTLRHSFASDAIMGGVPLAVVGKMLGHRRPSTTARYAHVSDTAVEEALQKTSERIVDAQQGRSEEQRKLRKRRKK